MCHNSWRQLYHDTVLTRRMLWELVYNVRLRYIIHYTKDIFIAYCKCSSVVDWELFIYSSEHGTRNGQMFIEVSYRLVLTSGRWKKNLLIRCFWLFTELNFHKTKIFMTSSLLFTTSPKWTELTIDGVYLCSAWTLNIPQISVLWWTESSGWKNLPSREWRTCFRG